MELLEMIESKLNQVQQIEDNFEREILSLVKKTNLNLITLEKKVDLSTYKQEVIKYADKQRWHIIDSARVHSEKLSFDAIKEAKSCALNKVNFSDRNSCLMFCLVDMGMLQNPFYEKRCLESLCLTRICELSICLNLDLSQCDLSHALTLLAKINYYETKPINKRVCKLVHSPENKTRINLAS